MIQLAENLDMIRDAASYWKALTGPPNGWGACHAWRRSQTRYSYSDFTAALSPHIEASRARKRANEAKQVAAFIAQYSEHSR